MGVRPMLAGALALALLGGCGDDKHELDDEELVYVEVPMDRPIESDVGQSTPDVGQPPPDVGQPEAEEPAEDPLHGEVQPGDSLNAILKRGGLDDQVAARVSIALSKVMDPATIRAGQRYDMELAEDGSLVAFSFRLSKLQTATVRADDKGLFRASVETLETTVSTQKVTGTVETSLWAAMTSQGHEPALVDVVVDVFAWDIDFFTSTRKGDQFRMLVERHEVDGEFVRYGRVLAGQYEGEAAKAQVYWWGSADDGRYVDEQGRGVQRTLLKTPLKYARISSGFNPARMHPVLHRVKSHKGVDYAAPEGTPVWAAADGKIVYRDKQKGAGNLVIVQHDGGLKTLYMHLSKFAKGQSVGQSVRAKTVIGYVGSTGLATGPHLHFGVKKNGKYVDPQKVESARSPGVPAKRRKAFERQRDAALATLQADEAAADAPDDAVSDTVR